MMLKDKHLFYLDDFACGIQFRQPIVSNFCCERSALSLRPSILSAHQPIRFLVLNFELSALSFEL